MMKIVKALKNDLENVNLLYQMVKGSKYCVWDEYPSMIDIQYDFYHECLYLLKKDDIIIGAISIVPHNEMDQLTCWKQQTTACEVARVVIHPKYQNQKLGFLMVNDLIEMIKKLKLKSIHLAVEVNNLPAKKLYKKCGFEEVGMTFMYGHNYYLYEKML